MSERKLVSPNDLHQAAQDQMLEGRCPVTKQDWALCVNFWAANIERGLEVATIPVLGLILECPLSRGEMVRIAQFQADKKG